MDKETLNFKIGLSGTYWDKRPAFEILINDTLILNDSIKESSGTTEFYEFTADVEEETTHTLKVRLTNKEDTDVVKAEDGSGISKDMLLNIVSVEVDNIELENLKWTKSMYYPDPLVDGFPSSGHVNLGFNGSWVLRFASPFYIWLLESM